MESKKRRTINKETQDAIKRMLMTSAPKRNESPSTPTIGLDINFSRILKRKREVQLEASRQRLFDSTLSKFSVSVFGESQTDKISQSVGSNQKDVKINFENSMMVGKENPTWNELSDSEDSFLALERQCNMEDKRERLMNANETLLFDVEPPSELFDQTINQSITIPNSDTMEEKNTESLPTTFFGVLRPSTIIEETSSQVDENSKSTNSWSTTTKSLFDDTKSTIKTVKECSIREISQERSLETGKSPLREKNVQENKERRGTFAFKRKNHTFFPDVNLISIDESESSINEKTPTRTSTDVQINVENASFEDDNDQFNNTLERVDYLLEKRKQILEETPVAKRQSHHNSLLETPLFSCKRKRMLSEMALREMQPLPKRGPLIDFSTPEPSAKKSKFDHL